MNVKSRIHRTLRHLSNYREMPLNSLPEWARGIPLEGGEVSYGFYENPPSRDTEIIVVSNLGLHCGEKGQWMFWGYADIESVSPASEKLEAEELRIKLRNGETALLPIRGRNGRFRDLFEFIRFLDRVRNDIRINR